MHDLSIPITNNPRHLAALHRIETKKVTYERQSVSEWTDECTIHSPFQTTSSNFC
jgi:hypothetical protein